MFANRMDAGEQLANVLQGLSLPENIVVLGIPRGGMVVAAVVSDRLHKPLGSVLVKKIGAPYNPELAIGAVGEGDTIYWDQDVLSRAHVSPDAKRILQDKVQKTIQDREKLFSSWYARPEIKGKTALLVDDGIATGATAICAAAVVNHFGAESVFLVTPVIPSSVVRVVRPYVSEIITLEASNTFVSVGQFYASFPEVTDEEVKRILLSREKNHSKTLQT